MITISTHLASFAQTCCSGGIPLSNSIGLPITDKGVLLVGLSYDYNYLNTLNSGKDKLDDQARLRTTQSVLLNIGYSFTSNLSVEGLFTYVNQTRRIAQFGNINFDETFGVGDGAVLFKYKLNNLLTKNNSLRIGLGTKIPLGATDRRSKQGILLNADLQPGSGAWDALFWSDYYQTFSFRPSATFSLSAIYRYTGTNNNYLNLTTYRFGAEFQGIFNYTDQFVVFKTLINPGISIKYRNANQDEIGGILLDNTGGEWVFAVPNLNIVITQNMTFFTKVEIPIYSYVDGTQLTPTYRITTSLFYTIGNKKNTYLKFK